MTEVLQGNEVSDSLQAYFHPDVAPDDIESIFRLKRAQPLLQAFSALFHGSFDGVLVRLLVLKELSSEAQASSFSRAEINSRLAYLALNGLESVLARLQLPVCDTRPTPECLWRG